jgi:microcystin degradation protein MlrC
VPYLWDPDAVQTAIQAGVGNRITLTVGGRSSARAGGPVEITGTVRFAGPKAYAATGPFKHGAPMDLGDCALIEAGSLTISLVSNLVMAVDDDPFKQFGLDVNDFDVVVLRSKTHFRAAWEDLAADILIVETPDWGPADLSTLPYRNVPPGVFPVTG